MDFIGRREELEILENEYARGSSFTVVYGRRRVGKTTLVHRFVQDRDALYFLATEESVRANLDRFSSMVSGRLGFEGMRFNGWYEAFDAATRNGKIVIVIDEFPYLALSDASIPSQFQNIWDSLLKDRNVMLILCGSFKGMMERYVLNRSSPLYGRRTAALKVRPLEYAVIRDAFPEKDSRQLVMEYAVHGGVPRYMELLDRPDLRSSISSYIANRNGVLYEEPLFLLNGEVRNPISYVTIMNCIAKGNVQVKDIAGRVEVPSNTVMPYIDSLVEMGFLERSVPPTEPNPERSRKGVYGFADLFTGFWFRFVYPYRAEIESGHSDEAMRCFDEHFIDAYASFVFEKVCRQLTWEMKDAIGIRFTRVGQTGNPDQIDVVAVDPERKEAFAAECKFVGRPVALNVLNDLREKCSRCRELKGYTLKLGVFSVSGFDANLREEAKRSDVLLIDV